MTFTFLELVDSISKNVHLSLGNKLNLKGIIREKIKIYDIENPETDRSCKAQECYHCIAKGYLRLFHSFICKN